VRSRRVRQPTRRRNRAAANQLSGFSESSAVVKMFCNRARSRYRVKRHAAIQSIAGFTALSATGLPLLAGAAMPAAPGLTPAEALARLKAGNDRFVAGALTNREGTVERREALTGHQAPFATILSCSDSRVPPELIFDEHIGDLFVLRNAGNFVTDAFLGTAEYGFANLGSDIIIVLGHESCGAISAVYDSIAGGKALPPHLDSIGAGIAPGISKIVADKGGKPAAEIANARAQAVNLTQQSTVLSDGVKSGKLKIVSAIYRLASGRVELV
jgi:carbonic anhydrase